MKKSILCKTLFTFFSAAFLCASIGCSSDDSSSDLSGLVSQADLAKGKSGQACVTMFVPDYLALLDSSNSARVVAPQTSSIKFGYNSGSGFSYLDPVNLSDAEKSAVSEEASDAGVSGYNYTFKFSGIPCGTYDVEMMEVQLLDSKGNAVSKGTNFKRVEVVSSSEAEAEFFTIPVSSDAKSGSLSKGEMKFLKVTLDSGVEGNFSISVGAGDSYPAAVVFAADGSFKKIVSLSAENPSFAIESSENSAGYYIGIWANEKKISSYEISSLNFNDENDEAEDEESKKDNDDEKSGSSTVVAVIDGKTDSFDCSSCGAHYESKQEAESCSKTKSCPGSKSVNSEKENDDGQSESETETQPDIDVDIESIELEAIEPGNYDLSSSGGFKKQAALSGVQVVNNIAVSSRLDDDCAVLKIDGKKQQGVIKFKVDKATVLVVTEILGNKQKEPYGVAIATADGNACVAYEDSICSLKSLPTKKSDGIDISNKTLILLPGTYELGACQAGKNVKVSNLKFTDCNELF